MVLEVKEIVRPKVRFVCSGCGSENVWAEAIVTWNNKLQKWEFCNFTGSDDYCDDCEDHVGLDTIPMTQEEYDALFQ